MNGGFVNTADGYGVGAQAAAKLATGAASADSAVAPAPLADGAGSFAPLSGIAREDRIRIDGKTYKLVGKPERMPVSVFRPARMLARKAAMVSARAGLPQLSAAGSGAGASATGNGHELGEQAVELLMAFYLENMDALIDVSYGLLRFALGAEQFAAAQEDIEDLDLLEFCQLGVELMGRYNNLGGY